MKETLEQAVSRIAGRTMCSLPGAVSVRECLEAALCEMAAWQRERDAEIAEGMQLVMDDGLSSTGITIRLARNEILGQAAAAIRKGE